MADGRSILKIKRKCSPEDILAIVCCLASMMALIFGLVNPKSPEQAFSSVKDAKNAAERGELDAKSEETQGAAGIVILVFLFIILIGTLLFALGLFLKSQWWKIKETFQTCCKKKEGGDPELERADRETVRNFLIAVEEAKAALQEEVLRKRKERLARRAQKARHVVRAASLSSIRKLGVSPGKDADKGRAEDAGDGEDI